MQHWFRGPEDGAVRMPENSTHTGHSFKMNIWMILEFWLNLLQIDLLVMTPRK